MKNVGIIPNKQKDPGYEFTRKIVTWLKKNDCRPVMERNVAETIGMPEYAADGKTLYTSSDFLTVLGGDGTMLEAAGDAAIYGKPLLGINLGTLGYLTDVDKNEAYVALSKVLQGNYQLEKRMMLSTILTGDSRNLLALNEVCVSRGVFSKMIRIGVSVNNEYLDTYCSDGIIISTPTGSTAYNLSAGGPILKPDGNMIAITHICPHALFNRSSVISADDEVEIKVGENSASDILLSMDGRIAARLKTGDSIKIRRANHHTTIIKTTTLGFYDILRKKMIANTR